jgi:hypothetical protein
MENVINYPKKNHNVNVIWDTMENIVNIAIVKIIAEVDTMNYFE